MQLCIEKGLFSIRQLYKNSFLIILFTLMGFVCLTDRHRQTDTDMHGRTDTDGHAQTDTDSMAYHTAHNVREVCACPCPSVSVHRVYLCVLPTTAAHMPKWYSLCDSIQTTIPTTLHALSSEKATIKKKNQRRIS